MNPKYVILSRRETEAKGYILPDSIDRTFWGKKQNHRDRKQICLCLELEGRERLIRKYQAGTFESEGDGNAFCLNCGDGYRIVCICQDSKNYAPKKVTPTV